MGKRIPEMEAALEHMAENPTKSVCEVEKKWSKSCEFHHENI